MQEQPFVRLEHTLSELFGGDDLKEEILLVPLFPSSNIALCPGIAANRRYLHYESSFSEAGSTTSSSDGSSNEEKLRQTLSLRRLTDFVHNMIFSAGSLTVVLCNPCLPHSEDGKVGDNISSRAHADAEITKTLAVLSPQQRPQIKWVESLKALKLSENQVLSPIMALDDLSQSRCILAPDLHYELASKEGLAHSGLPTPHSEIINFDTLPPSQSSCCAICRSLDGTFSRLDQCNGPRRDWLNQKIDDVTARILSKPLPYVVKLTQALGGLGTFIVRTSAEQASTIDFLKKTYLPSYLPLLTPQNLHLRPVNILLQDFHPGSTFAISFYVKKVSGYVFICGTTQLWNQENHWEGSQIVYSKQAILAQRMHGTLVRISDFLRGKGYFGPVGIDIVDSYPSDNDIVQHGDDGLWIVDLNVRMASSAPLGSLRPHFVSYGMDVATLLLVKFKGLSRAGFIYELMKDFENGRIVIIGWFEHSENENLTSAARVVVGGKDEAEVGELAARVRKLACT